MSAQAAPAFTVNHRFEARTTTDALGRTVTWYRTIAPAEAAPIVLFIQGSGCTSHFRLGPDGSIRGGYVNVVAAAAAPQPVRIIAVEKPGVRYLDAGSGGTAEGCSQTFREEHTLDRWAQALQAAVRAELALAGAPEPILALGHSEGGISAARLAAIEPQVSHVALLSANGPSQLFDFIRLERTRAASPEEGQLAVDQLLAEYAAIQASPDSAEQLTWSHPNRRWTSFLATSTLEQLLQSEASVYLAHGTEDQAVPLESFDLMVAELTRRGRTPTTDVALHAGHNLQASGGGSPLGGTVERALAWFLSD